MPIASETKDGVLVLRIDRPPVNALDVETLDEFTQSLERAETEEPRPVVLTGTGSAFSAGADLRRVLKADVDYISAGIKALTRAFRTLFLFSRPIVAAVNGYALAGGAVLTCGCDHRVMAEGAGPIGAIESAAGVPFPAWALELMRSGMNNEHLQEIVLFGGMYDARQALEKGIVDEVVPDDELMERALDAARRLGEIPRSPMR